MKDFKEYMNDIIEESDATNLIKQYESKTGKKASDSSDKEIANFLKENPFKNANDKIINSKLTSIRQSLNSKPKENPSSNSIKHNKQETLADKVLSILNGNAGKLTFKDYDNIKKFEDEIIKKYANDKNVIDVAKKIKAKAEDLSNELDDSYQNADTSIKTEEAEDKKPNADDILSMAKKQKNLIDNFDEMTQGEQSHEFDKFMESLSNTFSNSKLNDNEEARNTIISKIKEAAKGDKDEKELDDTEVYNYFNPLKDSMDSFTGLDFALLVLWTRTASLKFGDNPKFKIFNSSTGTIAPLNKNKIKFPEGFEETINDMLTGLNKIHLSEKFFKMLGNTPEAASKNIDAFVKKCFNGDATYDKEIAVNKKSNGTKDQNDDNIQDAEDSDNEDSDNEDDNIQDKEDFSKDKLSAKSDSKIPLKGPEPKLNSHSSQEEAKNWISYFFGGTIDGTEDSKDFGTFLTNWIGKIDRTQSEYSKEQKDSDNAKKESKKPIDKDVEESLVFKAMEDPILEGKWLNRVTPKIGRFNQDSKGAKNSWKQAKEDMIQYQRKYLRKATDVANKNFTTIASTEKRNAGVYKLNHLLMKYNEALGDVFYAYDKRNRYNFVGSLAYDAKNFAHDKWEKAKEAYKDSTTGRVAKEDNERVAKETESIDKVWNSAKGSKKKILAAAIEKPITDVLDSDNAIMSTENDKIISGSVINALTDLFQADNSIDIRNSNDLSKFLISVQKSDWYQKNKNEISNYAKEYYSWQRSNQIINSSMPSVLQMANGAVTKALKNQDILNEIKEIWNGTPQQNNSANNAQNNVKTDNAQADKLKADVLKAANTKNDNTGNNTATASIVTEEDANANSNGLSDKEKISISIIKALNGETVNQAACQNFQGFFNVNNPQQIINGLLKYKSNNYNMQAVAKCIGSINKISSSGSAANATNAPASNPVNAKTGASVVTTGAADGFPQRLFKQMIRRRIK